MLLPILICLSSFISQPDARLLGSVANARGYDVEVVPYGERTTNCDAVIMRGDADLTYRGLVTFDDGNAPLHYRYQSLTRAKARDLFTAWGQYESAVVERKAAAIGFVPDGFSTAYDFLSEGGL